MTCRLNQEDSQEREGGEGAKKETRERGGGRGEGGLFQASPFCLPSPPPRENNIDVDFLISYWVKKVKEVC